jgi:hypothetical protein
MTRMSREELRQALRDDFEVRLVAAAVAIEEWMLDDYDAALAFLRRMQRELRERPTVH